MLFKKNPSAGPSVAPRETTNVAGFPKPPADQHNKDPSQAQDPENDEETAAEDTRSPTGLKLALVLISVFTSMFLVSLDRMIVTTAVPQIMDDFHSIADIGWYGSAFLLTTCACQLLFGKLYHSFNVKAVFLVSVVLFEVGSAVCGAAPNSTTLIVGRAIAGIGGAGVLSGGINVIVFTTPLHKRPMYMGLFGAVFGISSVVGPLLGGAFTTHVTWRWCFYTNLPLGAVAVMIIVFLLKIPDRKSTNLPIRERLAQLDFYGTTLIVPGAICLVLAMQWGGSTYAWKDGRMIALLVLAFALLIGFALVQVFLPKTATIPPRIFVQRSILAGVFFSICTGAQMMLFTYYLPIWFQAIRGLSAVESGVRTLPILLPMVAASISSGVLIRLLGYYTPFMIGGVCFSCAGAGLLTTLGVNTVQAKWIGYQVLYGLGLGFSFQVPNFAAQTVLPTHEVPIGTSLIFFSQLLGGAIFVSVGQNVLNNQLSQRLSNVDGFNPAILQDAGATAITDLPPSVKPAVLIGYNESLRVVFLVGLIMTCLSVLGAAATEWKSVRQDKDKKEVTGEESGSTDKKTDDECDAQSGTTQQDASEKEQQQG